MIPPEKMRKSDRTRAAILVAATELFAVRGHGATTVRAVAERAGIDPALVIRYFGGKDGLFAAAARVDLKLPNLDELTDDQVGEVLVRHFLDIWEGEGNDMGLAVLLRSAVASDDVAAKIREIFATQVLPVVGRRGDPATMAIRTGLVVSQLFGLALCRYVLRLPPLVELSREEIVARVAPVLRYHLSGRAVG
jgi:AcrR family transcriptional regulator